MSIKGYLKNGYYYGYIPSVKKYWRFETEDAYVKFLRERGEA